MCLTFLTCCQCNKFQLFLSFDHKDLYLRSLCPPNCLSLCLRSSDLLSLRTCGFSVSLLSALLVLAISCLMKLFSVVPLVCYTYSYCPLILLVTFSCSLVSLIFQPLLIVLWSFYLQGINFCFFLLSSARLSRDRVLFGPQSRPQCLWSYCLYRGWKWSNKNELKQR